MNYESLGCTFGNKDVGVSEFIDTNLAFITAQYAWKIKNKLFMIVNNGINTQRRVKQLKGVQNSEVYPSQNRKLSRSEKDTSKDDFNPNQLFLAMLRHFCRLNFIIMWHIRENVRSLSLSNSLPRFSASQILT